MFLTMREKYLLSLIALKEKIKLYYLAQFHKFHQTLIDSITLDSVTIFSYHTDDFHNSIICWVLNSSKATISLIY